MSDLNVKRTAEAMGLTMARVGDLLATGFEGGVNYWCAVVDFRQPPVVEPLYASFYPTVFHGTVFKHVDYPLTGGAVICEVTDVLPEDAEQLELDGAALVRGLKALRDPQYKKWLAEVIGENDDADTGDVFIQLCLFGEVIYG